MKENATRNFKVLTEKISPDNVLVMAELIAMRETKVLIGYMGYHAEKAHKSLARIYFQRMNRAIYRPTVTSLFKMWHCCCVAITVSI